MNRATTWGVGLLLATAATLAFLKCSHPRDQRQELAQRLQQAGYKTDDAGRIIFENETGLSLAYDPNLRDPTIGFRECMGNISACIEATAKSPGKLDRCVRESSRCVSAKPWKGDPAGDDCCPESCVHEYFEMRKTQSEGWSWAQLLEGTCYPGMKEQLRGEKP